MRTMERVAERVVDEEGRSGWNETKQDKLHFDLQMG